MNEHKITCPKCQHEFNAEAVISDKLEAHFRAEYERKLKEHAQKAEQAQQKLETERKQLSDAQAAQNDIVKAETEKALKVALAKAKEDVTKTVAEDFEIQLKALQDENAKRKAENKTLKEKEVTLMAREASLKEQQEDLKIEVEKQLFKKQHAIEEKARTKAQEAFELEKITLLKQIEDNKKLAEEMKRKAEQGSMQLQGETQEIALENLLTSAYPFDVIAPVPKGIRGADCLQQVRNATQQTCGNIVYESKRTKAFANDWIEKLKNDQIACKADIAVLVTQVLPTDMTQFGERDGVWICDFQTVKSLSFVLRDMLIRTHSVRLSQENKGEKMEMLYQYLTSNEFVQHVQRIVENYDLMHQQINDERKAMERLWKKREKQIHVVQQNLAGLFGAIEGYTGKALEESDVFGLPEGDEQRER